MYRLFEHPLPTRAWPTAARYAVTLVLVIAALMATGWLRPHLDGHVFLFFFAAVIACAVLFNHGSSVLAVALSAALTNYFFLAPILTFEIERAIVPWLIYILLGLVVGVVVEAMHVAVHRLHEANKRLTSSEAEKDLLLREASHRTRNDLQMLCALVDLQVQAVAEPAARAALAATRARIRLLGEVQQRLRRTPTDTAVDMSGFVGGLCDDLRNTLLDLRPISLIVEAESHDLPQQRAVAVGLIINEALTNALKHAFPVGRGGTVTVRFTREDGDYVVSVRDDGIGADGTPDGSREHLGQRLIRSMVAQLRGKLEVTVDGGTIVAVRFPAEG